MVSPYLLIFWPFYYLVAKMQSSQMKITGKRNDKSIFIDFLISKLLDV